MKYARVEKERRFLIRKFPEVAQARTLAIQDWYLSNTNLRLRCVEEPGKLPVYKLGQKIRIDDLSLSTVAHTTMYLSENEFEALRALPSKSLMKTRALFPFGDLFLVIDEFDGELKGLMLAEIDLGVADVDIDSLPIEIVAEVTDDERFTGGALASTLSADLHRLLVEHGVK